MRRELIEGVIPNANSCYELLESLEADYKVSLKFWVTLGRPHHGSVFVHVYCTGSGSIFDLPDCAIGTVHSPVLQSQDGSIYPAMWSCLCQLRTILKTNVKPYA